MPLEQQLADFAKDSAERDYTRTWPIKELDAFSQSGLWSINVPKKFGGPKVSYATLAKVVEIISAADSSIGQISQNHLGVVAAIRTVSDEPQQELLFSEVLRGTRFGNAFSEFGSKRAADFETKFTDAGDHVIVSGQKFYSTSEVTTAGSSWFSRGSVQRYRDERAPFPNDPPTILPC